MQLQNNKNKQLVFWIIVSVLIYITENFIPRPLPWLKIGFANIVFLILLKNEKFKISDLFVILIFRNLIAAFVTGAFLVPIILVNTLSCAISIIAMKLFFIIFNDKISFLSVSVIGALVNMGLQVSIGSLIIFKNFLLLNMRFGIAGS